MNKKELRGGWRKGDNVKIVQRLKTVYGIEITGQAVGQWINGVNGSRIESLLIEAAKEIQAERAGKARQSA